MVNWKVISVCQGFCYKIIFRITCVGCLFDKLYPPITNKSDLSIVQNLSQISWKFSLFYQQGSLWPTQDPSWRVYGGLNASGCLRLSVYNLYRLKFCLQKFCAVTDRSFVYLIDTKIWKYVCRKLEEIHINTLKKYVYNFLDPENNFTKYKSPQIKL